MARGFGVAHGCAQAGEPHGSPLTASVDQSCALGGCDPISDLVAKKANKKPHGLSSEPKRSQPCLQPGAVSPLSSVNLEQC